MDLGLNSTRSFLLRLSEARVHHGDEFAAVGELDEVALELEGGEVARHASRVVAGLDRLEEGDQELHDEAADLG